MSMVCLDFIEIARFHDAVTESSYEFLSFTYHYTMAEVEAVCFCDLWGKSMFSGFMGIVNIACQLLFYSNAQD